MYGTSGVRRRRLGLLGVVVLVAALVTAVVAASAIQAGSAAPSTYQPKFSKAVAFDTSKPLRELAKSAKKVKANEPPAERGRAVADKGHVADGALQSSAGAGIGNSGLDMRI